MRKQVKLSLFADDMILYFQFYEEDFFDFISKKIFLIFFDFIFLKVLFILYEDDKGFIK